MLTENDVIRAVYIHLERQGFAVHQSHTTAEQGTDIIAGRPTGETILVEAKGETSSKEATPRFGKPFNASQVFSHVSKAFFTAAKLTPEERGSPVRVAIALPDTALHRRQIEQALHAFAKLEIAVWLVNEQGDVRDAVAEEM